ncbi:hypothetical protein L7F22_015928 [Adiantum nelumboides]|nr:hypothetical protein [Adiantum nelumboides]
MSSRPYSPGFCAMISDRPYYHVIKVRNATSSDHLLRVIGYAVENSATSCSATCCLEYICCKFGAHIRYLRLRGSLCTMELSTLLSSCTELQHVVCSHIDTAIQVEGLCLLLNQKRGRLQILEFQNCRFSECGLLKIKGSLMASDYRLLLRHLFVHSSQTLLIRSSEYFLRFLQSCSYLQSLVLIDNQVDLATVSDLLSMIVTRMPHLSLFHVRENELTGLALPFPSSFHTNNLSSLKALDVRSNNINLQDLEEFLPYFDFMPSLKLLNISDNPIGDDGLIALLPVLQGLQLSELSLSACNLSMKGVCSLFDVIISSDHSLRSLSISQNFLSSSIAAPLANFLRFGMVERLDLGEIGLGMDGCLALQSALNKMPRLSHFILRKNRIGSAGAALISKLVATPNALKEIDLSSNLLDKQCLQSVASYLESLQGGMLELVDLRNNLAEESKIFENIKKPQVLLSEVGKFYDDDP